ncbi:MAG: sigma-70 family RNA polymerase sigma factor [Nodosilinea sp.]
MDPPLSTLNSVSEPSDSQLWLAVQQGNTEALAQLYDRHAGLVYGIALRTLGPIEAEDLTQDIFLKLSQGVGYDPARGSLRTYLAILTRSRARDRLRSRQSHANSLVRLTSATQRASPDLPTERLVSVDRWAQVNAALAELTERQQQVLRMAYYEGMTQAAIAEKLNTPLGTVKALARRGLLKLRQLLPDSLE